MPRTKWKRPKKAGRLFLAEGKRDAQGVHKYCKKCLLAEICDNVQYNAKNSSIWCADNPSGGSITIEIPYGGGEPKMEACDIVAFPEIQQAAKDSFERIFPEGAREIRRGRRNEKR